MHLSETKNEKKKLIDKTNLSAWKIVSHTRHPQVITALNITIPKHSRKKQKPINMDVRRLWYPQVHPPKWARPMVDYRGMLHPKGVLFGGENDCKSFQPLKMDSLRHWITIDRFHMTSRRPYLCTKQWLGGHVCVQKKSCGNWTLFTC